MVETTEKLARSCSVWTEDGRAGATYFTLDERRDNNQQSLLFVGVDFGTTNSVIHAIDESGKGSLNRDKILQYGVDPHEACEHILWLAAEPDLGETVGKFLPAKLTNTKEDQDSCLFPSALWRWEDKYMIRWSPSKPVDEAQSKYQFKWMSQATDLRRAFIKEMFLCSFPIILSRHQLTQTSNLTVNVSFSFPLAFDNELRKIFIQDINDVKAEIENRCGMRIHLYSINESQAVANLLGEGDIGQAYIIADMGGGTLDVSLLVSKGRKNDEEQLGSLRFAGETFLRRITDSESQIGDPTPDYESLKDRLLKGELIDDNKWVNSTRDSRHAFFWMALEYLRVMASSHFHNRNEGEKRVKIELVGNGWRLAPVFSSQAKSSGLMSAFHQFYRDMLDYMGAGTFEYDERLYASCSGKTKHLVAFGALDNACHNQLDQINEVNNTLLPIGHDITISSHGMSMKLEWNELVGPTKGFDIPHFDEAKIQFDFTGEPKIPDRWRQVLEESVKKDAKPFHPDEDKVRKRFRENVTREAKAKVGFGVTQIVLEDHWKNLF